MIFRSQRAPELVAFDRLRDAFIAALLWDHLNRLGGAEVGLWLDDDIDEAFDALQEVVPDWGLQERTRWACFEAAQRWCARHADQIALWAELELGEEQLQ